MDNLFFYLGGQSVSCKASLAALRLYGYYRYGLLSENKYDDDDTLCVWLSVWRNDIAPHSASKPRKRRSDTLNYSLPKLYTSFIWWRSAAVCGQLPYYPLSSRPVDLMLAASNIISLDRPRISLQICCVIDACQPVEASLITAEDFWHQWLHRQYLQPSAIDVSYIRAKIRFSWSC